VTTDENCWPNGNEGKRNKVYDDSAGLPTIGVGHLLTQEENSSGKITINGQPIDYSLGLTDQQVMDLLAQDLVRFEQVVQNEVRVDLNQNQFDALVSFSFNVGTQAFKNSTLLKVLNDGLYEEVPDQLRRWVKAGGKTVQGLVNRRENEINLWNS
jgi:lysozyme